MVNRKKCTFLKWLVISTLLLVSMLIISGICMYAEEDAVLRVRAREGMDIVTFDPSHYAGPEFDVDLALYSKLIRFKPNSTETELDVAKSLKVSEDGKTIYFELKKGIQFHKGYGEMTAEDVKFSFETRANPELSDYAGDWATLDHVEVTGRYSGKIILKKPMPSLFVRTLPFTSGSIISKKAYEELGDKFSTNPVGSGPYYVDKWIPKQKLVLKRFDKYYGKLPDFEKIVIYPIQDKKTAEMAFDRGELDTTEVAFTSAKKYRKKPDVNVQVITPLEYWWVGFNMAKPPFDDIRVRKAIRYTIDVNEILEGAFNGVAKRANTILSPIMPGYWEDAPAYKVDLSKARQLLEEAGYPNGFKTTLAVRNIPVHLKGAQIVKEQLEKVGIKAQIKPLEEGEAYPYLGHESHSGMYFYSYIMIFDPSYWFEWFTCDQIGKWNYPKWCNKKFDALLSEATTTVDPEKREQLYIQLQKIMDEEVVVGKWITHGAYAFITPKNIKPAFLAQYRQYMYWQKTEEK